MIKLLLLSPSKHQLYVICVCTTLIGETLIRYKGLVK